MKYKGEDFNPRIVFRREQMILNWRVERLKELIDGLDVDNLLSENVDDTDINEALVNDIITLNDKIRYVCERLATDPKIILNTHG